VTLLAFAAERRAAVRSAAAAQLLPGARRPLRARRVINVKKSSSKNLKKTFKNVKRDKNKKPFVNVIKTLPLISVVQLHA